jgi:hypothetical protein
MYLLMSTSHLSPVYPGGHAQENEATPSVHTAPLAHGRLAQSSTTHEEIDMSIVLGDLYA